MTVRDLMRKLEFAPKDLEIATVVTNNVTPINNISFVSKEYKGQTQSCVVLDWRANNV